MIDRIVAQTGRRIDEASPMVDARLPDGSRVNAIIPPLAITGPSLTVRKFSREPLTIDDLIAFGTLSHQAAAFLEACVEGKLNVLVSGGTGTGKTTMLNVLSSFIPERERIVTIEDAAELRLSQKHVISLESRPANIEGKGQITIRDLVRNALRMRPDRIIVGECRGAETVDMLQAMNTGHDGSLTTIHANSPRDALARIETLVLTAGFDLPLKAIRDQIASAFDLIIHTQRLVDGRRRITHITEVPRVEGDVITLTDIFVAGFVGRRRGRPGLEHDAPHRHPARVHRQAGAERRVAAEVVLQQRDRGEGGRAAARAAQERVMRLRHALGVAFAIAATLTPAALAADTAAPPQVSGVSKVDGHTVRVIVRAPGDLTGLGRAGPAGRPDGAR